MYKATKKFMELDTSNAHQGLTRNQFYSLKNGESVSIEFMPKKLLDGKYIEKVKISKEK